MHDGDAPARDRDNLSRIAPLTEPVRRRVYEYVAASPGPVSRDEVAAGVGIARPLAVFHLERLLEGGLIAADQEGAGRRRERKGRPEKRYRRAAGEVLVSVPPRSYELAASVFADALASIERPAALDAAARSRGRALGLTARSSARRPRTQRRLVEATTAMLAAEGFAPAGSGGEEICLRNCPFAAVAQRHRDVICTTNLSLVGAALEAAGVTSVRATLEPAPDRCCVVLRPTPAGAAGE